MCESLINGLTTENDDTITSQSFLRFNISTRLSWEGLSSKKKKYFNYRHVMFHLIELNVHENASMWLRFLQYQFSRFDH